MALEVIDGGAEQAENLWPDYVRACKSHDWFHAMSDNYGVHQAGKSAKDRLDKLHARMRAVDEIRADVIYWKCCPWMDVLGQEVEPSTGKLMDDRDIEHLAIDVNMLAVELAGDPAFETIVELATRIGAAGLRINRRKPARDRAEAAADYIAKRIVAGESDV